MTYKQIRENIKKISAMMFDVNYQFIIKIWKELRNILRNQIANNRFSIIIEKDFVQYTKLSKLIGNY